MKLCTRCNTSQYVEKDEQGGVLVCTQCGTIIDESDLTYEDFVGTSVVYKDVTFQTDFRGGGPANSTKSALKKRNYHTFSSEKPNKSTSTASNVTNEVSNFMITQIDLVSDTLGFNTNLKQELLTLCTFTIRKLPNLKFMRTRLVVGAFANIIIKQNKKPVSLLEISNKVGVEFYALGKITRYILKEMEIEVSTTDSDIHIFIDRIFSHFSDKYASDELKSLKKLSVEIIHFLSLNHVIEGRHPPTMVCCAVYLSMKTMAPKTKINPDIEKLTDLLSIKGTTSIKKRIKEIEQLMINYSKQTQTTILKSMTINLKNLPHYTSFIVNDCLMSSQSRINDEDDVLYGNEDQWVNNNNSQGKQSIDSPHLSPPTIPTTTTSTSASAPSPIQLTPVLTPTSTPPATGDIIPIAKDDGHNQDDGDGSNRKRKKKKLATKPTPKRPGFSDYLSMFDQIGCPPSFIKSSYKRMRRRLNVIDAKQRLLSVMSPDQLPPHICITQDDLQFKAKYGIFSNGDPCVGQQELMELHQHLTKVDNLQSDLTSSSTVNFDEIDFDNYIPNSKNIYETLLLNNINEDSIIEAVFHISDIQSKKILSKHPNLSSVELSEHDVSKEEMETYLRTSEEKRRFQMIVNSLDDGNSSTDDDDGGGDNDNDKSSEDEDSNDEDDSSSSSPSTSSP